MQKITNAVSFDDGSAQVVSVPAGGHSVHATYANGLLHFICQTRTIHSIKCAPDFCLVHCASGVEDEVLRDQIDGTMLPFGMTIGDSWMNVFDQALFDRSGEDGSRYMQVKDVFQQNCGYACLRDNAKRLGI